MPSKSTTNTLRVSTFALLVLYVGAQSSPAYATVLDIDQDETETNGFISTMTTPIEELRRSVAVLSNRPAQRICLGVGKRAKKGR